MNRRLPLLSIFLILLSACALSESERQAAPIRTEGVPSDAEVIAPVSFPRDPSHPQVAFAVRPFLGEGQFPHEIANGIIITGNVTFSGPIILNGKKINQLPPAPDIPKDWAEGLAKLLESALARSENLKPVPYFSRLEKDVFKNGPLLIRTVLGDFGKDSVERDGEEYILARVVLDVSLIDTKRGEVITSFRAEAEARDYSGHASDELPLHFDEFQQLPATDPLKTALVKAFNESVLKVTEFSQFSK